MKTHPIATVLPLAHQATLRIVDPAHLEITCTRGSLWLTLDHDRRDIVLTAGTADVSFTTHQHRPLLIHALQDSELTVTVAGAQIATTQAATLLDRFTRNTGKPLLPLAPPLAA